MRKRLLVTTVMLVLGVIVGLNVFKPAKQINVSSDYPVATSLGSMVKEADYVVYGHIESFDSKWNMARNPDNIEMEDNENYTEGHIYNFIVEQNLKGNLGEKIKVNYRVQENIEIKDNEDIFHEVAVNDPLFIEPKINGKYILFLNKDNNFDIYYGAVEPFQIFINDELQAELKTNLTSNISQEQSVKIGEEEFLVVNESHYEGFEDKITGLSVTKLLSEITSILMEEIK